MNKFNYDKYLLMRNETKSIVNKISFFRLLIFLFIIISFILGAKVNIFNIIGVILIFAFIILIFIHDRYYKRLNYYEKYLNVLEQYKDRDNGNWKKFKDIGEEYSSELFMDLNIVGKLRVVEMF